MPHISYGEGTFEDMREWSREYNMPLDEAGYTRGEDGDYHTYEPAAAAFTPDQLEGAARPVYDALRALGITEVHCGYDGGGDEGFAHFENATLDGQTVRVQELAVRFADGPLGEVPPDTADYMAPYWGQMARDVRARAALDDFAYALATILLGDGFGTGEYTMEGRFRADLSTGHIVDERL